jgi:hypothetical protein
MRGARATNSADRVSGVVIVMAGLLVGVFVFFVALPIAMSSPYPTPSRQDWATARAVPMVSTPSFQLASAGSVAIPKLADRPAALAPTPKLPDKLTAEVPAPKIADKLTVEAPAPQQEELAPVVRTASLIIFRKDDAAPVAAPAAVPPVSEEAVPAEDVQAEPAVEEAKPEPRRKRDASVMAEVDAYLWEVYQRQPMKKDGTGDFTWKDPAAAKRVGKTLQAYVIMGMDPDLREALFHAGKAMDKAGIEWSVVSAFRDDYRQSIAAGLKARTGYSRHGGSRATGGYGHGLAVDVGHVDAKRNGEVWRWFDAHGMKYGLTRPIRHFDPPHVEPRGNWRKIARDLRHDRTGVAVIAGTEDRAESLGGSARRKARSRVSYSARRSARGRR